MTPANRRLRFPLLPTLAILALAACASAAWAQTTAISLYKQCTGSDSLMASALSGAMPNSLSNVVMFAKVMCQDQIVQTWNAFISRGDRFCPSPGGTVSEDQLELVFTTWAQRHPEYLGRGVDQVLYTSWREAFPCR